jgi:N-carbamoylputrescine amidase
MQGHSAANMVPLVASNRVGSETSDAATMTFYGHSFITGFHGEKLAEAGGEREVVTATVDLERARMERASWGFFRDRRPEFYDTLLTLDGKTY